ncbi:uncharacterized protein LOC114717580 [Neltuma alba]|uniref:uncharacterized protein LOC114717580 n=1 Tax=Neltuma alba TaxID=207710 RepID=UPI0010A4A883|nr:uncharacterized protein LOC114717580 [Prosopis alba]
MGEDENVGVDVDHGGNDLAVGPTDIEGEKAVDVEEELDDVELDRDDVAIWSNKSEVDSDELEVDSELDAEGGRESKQNRYGETNASFEYEYEGEEEEYEEEDYESEGEEDESMEEDTESEGEEDVSMEQEFGQSESQKAPFFSVGMTFGNAEEIKSAINQYAIAEGVNMKLIKSDSSRIKAVCQKDCPFVVYASKEQSRPGLKVKTLCYEHRCLRVFKNKRASAKWLANHFKKKIQEMPQYKASEMKKDVEIEFKVHVSIHKCKRAKRLIMDEMEGSYKDEFQNLEAYCKELRTSNPGSDISVEVSKEALENGRREFRRMYVCFNACKVGWKAGCRPFIGLDGTFLKGKAKGILLTATGIDANDCLYPLAFGLT